MSAVEELTQLYSQWRLLTEQEGTAIAGAAWLDVAQCQAAKVRLQPRIEELSRQIETAVHESRFRSVLDDLIELEQRNSNQLKVQRSEAEAQVLDCDRSCRSLRQIQRLYIPQARQNWQSYS